MATDEDVGLDDKVGSALDGVVTGFCSALFDGSQALSPSPQTNVAIITLPILAPQFALKDLMANGRCGLSKVYTWADAV